MLKRLLILTLIITPSLSYSGLFNIFEAADAKKKGIPRILTTIEEKREQAKRLQESLSSLEKNTASFNETIQKEIDEIDNQRSALKINQVAARGNDSTFYDQARSLLNEQYQTLINSQLIRKEEISIIKEHISLLEDLFKDPNFDTLRIKPHSYYSYKDLQSINKKMLTTREKLTLLTTTREENSIDLDNRMRKLTITSKAFEEKKKEQEEFGTKDSSEDGNHDFTFRQQGELLDLEVKFFEYERRLDQMRVDETKSRISKIESGIAIEKEKLRIFKNDIAIVRDRLRIDAKDLDAAAKNLEKIKLKYNNERDTLVQKIHEINAQKNSLNKDFEELKERYDKIDIAVNSLGDWSIIPTTIEEWLGLCDLGYKFEQIQLLESSINVLKAQLELEKVHLTRAEVNYAVHKTLYNLTHRSIKNDDELRAELKKFQDWEKELKRVESGIKDKIALMSNRATLENKSLTNIAGLITELEGLKETTFKTTQNKYRSCLKQLKELSILVEEQLRNLNAHNGIYNQIGTSTNTIIQDLSSIINELEAKSIWQRSEAAISFQGVGHIPTDLQIFARSIINLASTFIASLNIKSLIHSFKNLATSPINLFNLFLKLLLLLIGFYLMQRYVIKRGSQELIALEPENKYSLILSKGLGGILAFMSKHFISIYCWFTLLILIRTEYISDLFIHVLFYLGSIVYLCYLVHAFIVYFIHYNADQEYVLFNSSFEKQFAFIVSLFGYLTVTVLLFREAFIAATYHPTEFPTILMALYTTLTPILIIPLIGKDELLSLIPQKGVIWKSIADFINNYYYALLVLTIIIIILSDPRVGGYGNLVTYFFWGIVGSLILVKLLIIAQTYLRKSASQLFFYHEDDQVRERFKYSTTWFGLFVIALFIVFVLVGITIGLRIWGKAITWDDIYRIFMQTQLVTVGADETGKAIWVTPYRIVGVIGYIIAGFGMAYAINKFVIRRIFQLLPVDLGVQNTVTSLVRYVVIIAAIYLGFNMAGMGTLLIALGLAVGSIAYFNKEPLADFIAYFLILVQRPVKIGDYVVIGATGISGVVRQITARNTILRSKNSFSIVVPNATIITQSIKNWNYSGVFVAIDDMHLTVPYSVDPDKVRRILSQICEANTDILRNPSPRIRLENFGDNGYEFLLRAFISSTKTLLMWDIASDLRFAIIKEMQKNNITLAFPTRVVITAKSDGEAYHPHALAAAAVED